MSQKSHYAENSNFLGCYVVLTANMYRRFEGACLHRVPVMTFEDEGTVFLRNVGKRYDVTSQKNNVNNSAVRMSIFPWYFLYPRFTVQSYFSGQT
jgi:hypothetical protein